MTLSQCTIENKINAMITPNMGGNSHGLTRFLQVLDILGNPHTKIPPVVHVAGTNGKGSVIAFIQAILEQSGYSIHRFTSPHLIRYHERIVLRGIPIGDELLLAYLDRVHYAKDAVGVNMGFFDVLTACAFLAFSENPADAVLLETGIGGRLDVTNVIPDPVATVITPVSYDHRDILGDTLTQIATEKAHIQKSGRPSLIAPQQEEALKAILSYADAIGAKPYVCGQGWGFDPLPDGGFEFLNLQFPKPSLYGDHQITNGATAVATTMILQGEGLGNITPQTMQQGITKTTWHGRMHPITQGVIFDHIPPKTQVWLDGGHNESAGHAIAQMMHHLTTQNPESKTVAIVAMGHSKDSPSFLNAIAPPIKKIYTVPVPDHDRIMPPHDLAQQAGEQGIKAMACESLPHALQAIMAEYTDPRIFIIGSLYLAGHILQENT